MFCIFLMLNRFTIVQYNTSKKKKIKLPLRSWIWTLRNVYQSDYKLDSLKSAHHPPLPSLFLTLDFLPQLAPYGVSSDHLHETL